MSSILLLLAILFVLGVAAFVLMKATFIDEEFKGFIKWVLLAIGAVVVVVWVLSLAGVGPGLVLFK